MSPVATIASGPATSGRGLGRDQRAAWAAASAAFVAVALGVCVLYYVAAIPAETDAEQSGRTATALYVTGMVGLVLAGCAVVRQQPRAAIGWLLVAAGLAGVLARLSLGVAVDADAAGAPWTTAAAWVTNWSWVPAQALVLVLILRFPDGALPGRRWRWVEAAVLGWATATTLATALLPGELGSEPLAHRDNPLGVAYLEPVLDTSLGVLFTTVPLLALAAVAAPVVRWRGADVEERAQLRAVALALLLVAATAPLALVSDTGVVIEGVAYLAVPAALAWAVLRHRLWDVEVRRRYDRLRVVREEERSRLQQELHDALGPLLGSIGMRAEAARNLLAQGATDRVADALGGIDADATSAVVEVRRIIEELGPSALAESDLGTAVRDLSDGYTEGPTFVLDLPDRTLVLDPARELVAFRVVAEAVRNVVRHSAAAFCRVTVATAGDVLLLTVADDGVGLQGHPAGVGRLGMARRVAEVGGTLDVSEPDTGGVVVRAALPGAVR